MFLFGDRAECSGCIAASLWHGREQTAEKADLKPRLVPGVGLMWWQSPANNGSGCASRGVSTWKKKHWITLQDKKQWIPCRLLEDDQAGLLSTSFSKERNPIFRRKKIKAYLAKSQGQMRRKRAVSKHVHC